MAKKRMTINLTADQRKKLDEQYVQSIKNGAPRSYSELIGDCIDDCFESNPGFWGKYIEDEGKEE